MKDKRIPTIIGLILLFLFLIFGVNLTSQSINLSSKASGDCQPIGIQITNLTTKSLDLSFQTKEPCNSSIFINNQTLNNFSQSSTIHYFRVTNLFSKTNYRYKIVSGSKEYSQENYQISTPDSISSSIPLSNLAWGRVLNQTKNPEPNALIYLSIPGALPLSALTDENGQWHISFAVSLKEDKSNWFSLSDDLNEEIIVYSADGVTTQITHHTSQNDPLPDIIIGQNYFETNQSNTGQIDINPSNDLIPTSSSIKLDIKNPVESETIYSLRPDFFGIAPPNSSVTVKVESDPVYQDQVQSLSDGSWNWSPPANLSPGSHTITLSYTDPNTGLISLVKRNFIVVAAENSLAFSASASATIVKPSPTNISSPTIFPTPFPSPSLFPSVTPTIIPTIRTSKPSTTSAVPVTGNISPLFILTFGALASLAFSLYYYSKR